MSKAELAQVIGLAMIDGSFLSKLLQNPERAVQGNAIKLDEAEIEFLKERGTRYILENAARSLGVDYESVHSSAGKKGSYGGKSR